MQKLLLFLFLLFPVVLGRAQNDASEVGFTREFGAPDSTGSFRARFSKQGAGLVWLQTMDHFVSLAASRHTPHAPDDYLLFLGRFTPGKGPVQAIEVAKRAGMRLLLAAAEDQYYREHVAPLVDGTQVVYVGEVDFDTKVRLYGGARALLYPVQAGEPFGLVLAEAMACGTPVAALDRGAVREVVDEGVTGGIFQDLDGMVSGLPSVLTIDRARVRARAVERFGVTPMVNGYVRAFRTILSRRRTR